MKSFKILTLLALTVLFVSCNDDDAENLDGTYGDAELFFDNGMAGNSLELGHSYINSNNETLTVERLNYIISNVVLIKADGTDYAYPKAESLFVINHETGQQTIHLEQIPAGDYKKVRFGVGVDAAQYALGQEAQQTFWDEAVASQLGTTWDASYRFINFSGTFTSPEVPVATPFSVYLYNSTYYTEITLDLPTTARVRHEEQPSIHIKTDANVLLDGMNPIKLADNITGGSAIVQSLDHNSAIEANITEMFTVDHVHNGEGSHHEE